MKNKVAIVTGAAEGNGEGIACALLKKGAKVMLIDKNPLCLDTAAKYSKMGYDAYGFVYDITDKTAVQATVDEIKSRFGKIHILVNNAGVARLCRFEETSDDLLDFHININIKGTWNMTQAVLPSMKENNYGRIIIISSVTGTMVSDPGYTAYAITKAGLSGFTKALCVEAAPFGITVNAVCPGFILTPNVKRSAATTNPDNPQLVLDNIAAGVPLGRLGDIADVGALCAFLASEEAGYITGTDMVIDGGAKIPETGAMGLR